MENNEVINLEDMAPFKHRGVTYYADENENIYDGSGKLLGLISSRGAQYIWLALREDESEFARGSGVWEPSTASDDEYADPAMDGILNAHSERDEALDGRR